MRLLSVFILISIIIHISLFALIKPIKRSDKTPISENIVNVDVIAKENLGNKKKIDKNNKNIEQKEIKTPLNKDLKKEETKKPEKTKPKEEVKNKKIITTNESSTHEVVKKETPKKEEPKNKEIKKEINKDNKKTNNKFTNSQFNNKAENKEIINQKEMTTNSGSALNNKTDKNIEGKALYIPKPKYPITSRRNKEEGSVLFKLTISSNGRLEKYEIIKSSGFERLDKAAIDSIKKGKYEPAIKNNKKTSSNIEIRIIFDLEKYK